MQYVIFVGIKIKSDLSRYNWSCGIIRFNFNSASVLKQVSIMSHFSDLSFGFLRKVSFLLGVAWPHDQEVYIKMGSANLQGLSQN